jgi:hypothetical protein
MRSLIVIFFILLTQGCTLFKKDERPLVVHKKSNGEKISIYYVGMGATTNDVIQVKKSNQSTPVWVSEKYNYLESSALLNDSTLQIVVTDTGCHNNNNKLDTVIINVK